MLNKTYATLKPNAPQARVRTLVHALEDQGCTLPLQRLDQRLEFDIADCNLWWLAQGGLKQLFATYDDIASWPGNFYEGALDSAQSSSTSFVNA